jgi:hypothetical protein
MSMLFQRNSRGPERENGPAWLQEMPEIDIRRTSASRGWAAIFSGIMKK